MTLYFNELKRSKKSLIIWTVVIGFMMFVCMIMYPEMKNQMDEVSNMFANMGGFTQAFGMDKISIGTAIGFFGVEVGNVLGIGGALFAAIVGVGALSKEEENHTAEFLLTHPLSRVSIIAQKLVAVITQLVVLNVIVFLVTLVSFAVINEDVAWKEIILFHTANLICQLEIAAICFAVSACIKRGSMAVGIAVSMLLYFVNLFGNLAEKAEFVKYITPFKYAEATDIITNVKLDSTLVLIGIGYSAVAIVFAFWYYNKKDIAS